MIGKRIPLPREGRIAAVYCRKSDTSSGEAKGRSTAQQLEQCLMAAQALGYHIPEEHRYIEDDGVKGHHFWRDREGRHPGPHRPQLTRLMEALDEESGAEPISAIILWRTDRAFRDELVAGFWLRELRDRGVRLFSRTTDMALDTASGFTAASVEACANSAYRLKVSEDVRRHKDMAVQAGRLATDPTCLGFSSAGPGTCRAVPVQDQLVTVRLIFDWFVHGAPGEAPLSVRAISKRLMERGIRVSVEGKGPQPKDPGVVWVGTLMSILRNVRYVGKIRHNGRFYPTQAFHVEARDGSGRLETVISEADFEAAQAKLNDSWSHERDARAKMLSGALVCPDCGNKTYFHSKKDGYRAMLCPTRRLGHRECPKQNFRSLPMEDIEEWVKRELAPILAAEIQAMRALQSGDAERTELAHLDRRIADALKVEGERLASLLTTMDAAQFGAVAAQLKSERAALEKRAAELRDRLRKEQANARYDPFDLIDESDAVLRQALLRAVSFMSISQRGVTVLTKSGAYIGAYLGKSPRKGVGKRRPTILPPSVAATRECRSWIAHDREAFLVGLRSGRGRSGHALTDESLIPDYCENAEVTPVGVVTEVSWSFSRQQAWMRCPRSVFYAACWREEAELATAPRLRVLKTPAMVAGIVVDRMVNEALQNVCAGWPIPENLANEGVRRLTEQFARSPVWASSLLDRRYLPPEAVVLHGDFYGDRHPAEELASAVARTEDALRGFVLSELFARLVRCGGRGFVLPTSRVPSFDLSGTKVYAGPDFVLLTSGGRTLICDWKSGARSPTSSERGWRQLGVYGLYAIHALGLEPDALYAQLAWLRESPSWEPSPITSSLLQICEEELMKGVAEFRSRLHLDSPRGGALGHIADVEEFSARADPSVCRRCCYLRLCPEGQHTSKDK